MYFEDHSPLKKLQFSFKRPLPIILQAEAAECGLACLAMVACYYGYQTDLSEIRRKFSVSIEGMTLADIMRMGDKLELSARPLRLNLDDLKSLRKPAILHWDMKHFVVLKSTNKKGVIIHDPAQGEIKLEWEDVSKHFTGIALELSPTVNFKAKEAPKGLQLSYFWKKIIGLKRSLLIVFLLSLLLQLFILVAPYYLQLVVDDVILTNDVDLLVVLAAGFFLVLLFEVGSNVLRGLTLLHLSSQLSVQLGANLFHHLVRLPLTYFEKRHIGDIVSRFGSLQQVKQILTTGVIEAVIDGLMGIITLGMIFFYSPMLSFIVLITVFLYASIRFALYRSFRAINEQEITAKAEESSNFMETVRGIQTIKLFSSESKREGLWQNLFAKTTNYSIRVGHFQIGYENANRLLFGIENILVVFFAACLVIDGGFSTGMLFAFMAYKRQFVEKTCALVEKLIEFKMVGLHFERIADIAHAEKESFGSGRGLSVTQLLEGRIRLEGVCYQYSDSTPNVINDLNLTIDKGEFVAIVGPSGSGKSTLLKIILGLVPAQKGQVLVDDVPLDSFGIHEYRQQIAAVTQNDELLSGSVAENIAFFETPLDIEKVVRSAQLACIHDDISKMPMGYDSLIGDMGSSLSGGQKQRIILARALYVKPKILFMDEATSHLDEPLEERINCAISSLDITRVTIAHRQKTIDSADRVINLEHLQCDETEKKNL